MVCSSCGNMGIFHNHASFAFILPTLFFWWGKPKKILLFALVNTAIQCICVLSRILYLRYEVLEYILSPSQSPFFMNLYEAAFLGFMLVVILNLVMKRKINRHIQVDEFLV